MIHYFITSPDHDDSTPTEASFDHPPRPGDVIRLSTGFYHLVLSLTVGQRGVTLALGDSGDSEQAARLLAWQRRAQDGQPPPPGPSP